MTSSPSFESRVDALYALPLDEFVAGRKRLADELKRDGATAEAKSLLALAKPTLSAWLTNQTVRRAPELVRELLAATDAVAAAQRKQPRAGGGPEDFQAAVAAQRRVVAELATAARAAVGELAPGAATDALDRVENNFRWGAIAGPDRDALGQGRLVRDVAAPGFGGFEAAVFGEDEPAETAPAAGRGASAAPTADADKTTRRAGGKADRAADTDKASTRADTKNEAKQEAEAARERARAQAEAEREHRRLVAHHEAALRQAQAEIARARRELAREERDRTQADERLAAAETELASARAAREAAEGRRREAAETLASLEAAEATLRRSGPPAPTPSGGPFRTIAGR